MSGCATMYGPYRRPGCGGGPKLLKIAPPDRRGAVETPERYSSRHVVDFVKIDGSLVKQEVYLFGEQNTDGTFTRVEEVTMMLEGTESDRGLGNAR
jgi:hypothetical protein